MTTVAPANQRATSARSPHTTALSYILENIDKMITELIMVLCECGHSHGGVARLRTAAWWCSDNRGTVEVKGTVRLASVPHRDASTLTG
jgi:hypothetical protein